jgi:diguanylate cyclase
MGLFSRKTKPTTSSTSPTLRDAPAVDVSPDAITLRDAPAVSASSFDAVLDQAIDALAAVVRTLGRHAFDLADVEKESFGRRCEAWARNILTGAPPDERDDVAKLDDGRAQVRARAGRDFRGLQQFVLEHRRAELRFVESRLGELKEAIWQFVQGLRRIAGEEQAVDTSIRASLTQLEDAVQSDSIAAIRALVPRTVASIHEALELRRTHFEEHLAVLGAHLRTLRTDLLEARRKMELDPLTQTYNRGALDESLLSYLDLCLFAGQPLSLLMIDLDHFKLVNDRHGHPVGDRVLVAVARCLQRSFPRRTDFVARYGGEEFAVLLPDATTIEAARLAERLLAAVRQLKVEVDGQDPVTITCSVGYAELTATDDAASLIKRADAALYRAKAEGRDRAIG